MSDWSDDELEVIREVALADEVGLTPRDAYLPTYERLVERGVLVRKLLADGEPCYQASERFRTKAALMVHRAAAEQQVTWN